MFKTLRVVLTAEAAGWCFLLLSVSLFDALYLGGATWTAQRITSTKREGDRLIAALEEFRTVHGVYPARIEDLVPDHLLQIPQPSAGETGWDYYRPGADGEGFVLRVGKVEGRFYPCLEFWSLDGAGSWTLDE